jgi:tetratricopeptide (TPR) repeat protein
MRGTNDKNLYDKFVRAVSGFPPTPRDGKTAQEVFRESYALLDDLATNNPFPRALTWKAYALALSAAEGWPLPDTAHEFAMDRQARLALARKLGEQAAGEDKTDYDLQWGLADVYLLDEKFDLAVAAFNRALELNKDARHPSLFAEAASAMMQAGDFKEAERLFRRARLPDWHKWMHGIFLFLKAGRAEDERETYLNLALEELKSTQTQVGDDFYQGEIQLVLAGVHWRKSEFFRLKAGGEGAKGEKALFDGYAARNLAAARRAMEIFRAEFSYWDVETATTALTLQDCRDKKWWRDTVTELWKL